MSPYNLTFTIFILEDLHYTFMRSFSLKFCPILRESHLTWSFRTTEINWSIHSTKNNKFYLIINILIQLIQFYFKQKSLELIRKLKVNLAEIATSNIQYTFIDYWIKKYVAVWLKWDCLRINISTFIILMKFTRMIHYIRSHWKWKLTNEQYRKLNPRKRKCFIGDFKITLHTELSLYTWLAK